MDDRRRKALRQCHQALRTTIKVSHFLPRLHIDAGGFLTDVESANIRDKLINVAQVDELIEALATKQTKDFDYLCDVLEKEGYQVFSNQLKTAAGVGEHCSYPCKAGHCSRLLQSTFDLVLPYLAQGYVAPACACCDQCC